jgi:hypothetical protein
MPRRPRTAALLALVAAAVAPAGAAASMPSANPPGAVKLSNERTTTRWAHTADPQPVFSRPSDRAHRVARLRLLTEDKLPEVYLVLSRWKNDAGNTWLKIRVPMRPNGRTGWVREDALGALHTVHTQLVVNRHTLRVTLYDHGKRRFSARIGVGKASTPTPAGHFWDPREVPRRRHDDLRSRGDRDQRVRPDAVGVARRRGRRPARHQRARAHPGAPVARLHPPAQPRHREALSAGADGHPGGHPLSVRKRYGTRCVDNRSTSIGDRSTLA